MAASTGKTSRNIGGHWSDIAAKWMFRLSVLLIAFAFGVATMKYKIFPYTLITHAEQAIAALHKVEDNSVPAHFIRYLGSGETNQITKAAPAGEDPDLILMTGGFFYRTDICPKVGCMAWVMKRDGTVLHRWSYDPAALFAPSEFKGYEGKPGPLDVFVQGADLAPDGSLVVIFETRNAFPDHVGIAKFGPDGRLLWKRMDRSHHWPTVGPDGRIYAPFSRIISKGPLVHGLPHPPNCRGDVIDEQGVRVLSPNGEVLHEFSMSDVLRDSDMQALGYLVRDDCDPYHVNGIELVNDALAANFRRAGVADAQPGDLIVSLRSSSSLVVMDSETGRIKHVVNGPMVEQHSPAVMPDGGLLIFDNVGWSNAANRRSRVLKLSFGPERYEQLFPRRGGDDPHLFTANEGSVNVSADGKRALVAETEGGRLFEIDLATGAVLWAYRETDDISAYAARIGGKAPDKPALMHTQGAAFISKDAFARMFGPN